MNTWRTTPATRRHAIRRFLANKTRRALRAPRLRRNLPSIPSSALRSCRRADLWPAASAPARNHPPAAPRKQRRGARRLRASAHGAEMSPRRRGARAAQLSFHGHKAQAGVFGVQMVAPRSIMAWAKSPARRGGVSAARQPANFRLRRRQRRRRSHRAARSRARHCRRPASPARQRRSPRWRRRYRRRCRASARKLGFARRKFSAVPLDHGAGAGMQIAGAGVIAEPGPGFEHIVERRRRQRAQIGPARQETRVIGRDGLDRGLLQHDFGEPDAIRIGALGPAARATAARGDAGRTRRAKRWVAVTKPPRGPCARCRPAAFAASVVLPPSWPRDGRAAAP